MNKLESKLYKVETLILVMTALLMVFHLIAALISGIGNSGIVVFLTGLIGFFSLPFLIWRVALKNTTPRNITRYAFALIMNRVLLYFLAFCSLTLSCYIPNTIAEARNYRIKLKQARIDHRFLCQYVNGEAPIDNGIWVYRYLDTHSPNTFRGRRFAPTQIDFTASYKNGQLHGLAKEEYGNRVVEKYYTNGQLDSSMFFWREFRGRNGRDTLIFNRVMTEGPDYNGSEYYYLDNLCNLGN